MKVTEFIKQFMQGQPLTMTLRNPEGQKFTAEYVIVRGISCPAAGTLLKEEPAELTLVLTGPELEK